MAGEMDRAKAALAELRRVEPNISLAWMANQKLVNEKADRAHYLEAFRRGLGLARIKPKISVAGRRCDRDRDKRSAASAQLPIARGHSRFEFLV
jgi:hypothetical protein